MHKDGGKCGSLHIFYVEEGGIKDEHWSEVAVAAYRVEKAAFLISLKRTISFSTFEKSGGRYVLRKSI